MANLAMLGLPQQKAVQQSAANRQEAAAGCRNLELLQKRHDRTEAEQWQDGDCTNCLKADTLVAPSQAHDAV